MTIEELDRALDHPNIKVQRTQTGCAPGVFCREREFIINDVRYEIVWYHNHSTIRMPGGCEIMFDRVKQSGTWPSRSKLNLHFYIAGETSAVIPIEYWENK